MSKLKKPAQSFASFKRDKLIVEWKLLLKEERQITMMAIRNAKKKNKILSQIEKWNKHI